MFIYNRMKKLAFMKCFITVTVSNEKNFALLIWYNTKGDNVIIYDIDKIEFSVNK